MRKTFWPSAFPCLALALQFVFFNWPAATHAQAAPDEDVLAKIHERLTSAERLNYHDPSIFVGEISRLGPYPTTVCKSAISQEVDFAVSQWLFGNSKESVITAGFINCTMGPLPSPPFTLHAKVIVYCEHRHRGPLNCMTPVVFSEAALEEIQRWVSTVKQSGGDFDLAKIHDALLDAERLARHDGFVFTGEVSRNEQIHQKRCATGVEQVVAYRVSDVLWNYADSLVGKDYSVSKGFIDCKQRALAEPFTRGTKIIVHCELEHGAGYRCDDPVLFSEERLKKVQVWVNELREREGDPELLQIHYHLRDSLELAPTRPKLIFGKVLSLTANRFPVPQSVAILPTMQVAVSDVLWGYYKEAEVKVICPNRNCSTVTIGSEVIVYCEFLGSNYTETAPYCRYSSTNFSDESVKRVKVWVSEARQKQPVLILEKIKETLAEVHSGPRYIPSVYRGHVDSIGTADNGVPLEHFVDTSGTRKKPVNLLFRVPYARTPGAIEIGKKFITFCYQQDDICYAGEEATGIIGDSDEIYREIERLIDERK
ncbi:MAG TPA: hypothetical protein VN025_05070 [Candidatus Dormibacteraeota bacterium]|nr:hypothetical protein [Candidatus Dormibacteraeota bacterium]